VGRLRLDQAESLGQVSVDRHWALLVGAVGYASKHPALIWVAVGMLIGWLATRVVSWMLLRHRGDSIDDWYAFSFLLPTEATGLWLVGLTRDEPYLAFHFIIRTASNYPVEITSIKGTISVHVMFLHLGINDRRLFRSRN
jgi:hypothetical protein